MSCTGAVGPSRSCEGAQIGSYIAVQQHATLSLDHVLIYNKLQACWRNGLPTSTVVKDMQALASSTIDSRPCMRLQSYTALFGPPMLVLYVKGRERATSLSIRRARSHMELAGRCDAGILGVGRTRRGSHKEMLLIYHYRPARANARVAVEATILALGLLVPCSGASRGRGIEELPPASQVRPREGCELQPTS
jgi:hypothetical protein